MPKHKTSPGYNWARRHALPTPAAAAAWQFQDKLEQSQWFGANQHLAYQFRHLNTLVRHAVANTAHYAHSLADVNTDRDLAPDAWGNVPILTRRDLQQKKADLTARAYPASHGTSHQTGSSGSTGRPVEILGTDLTETWHKALTLRAQLWSMTRFDRKLAVIRRYANGTADYPKGLSADYWADDLTLPMTTGPVACLSARTAVPEQVGWLTRENPQALVIYPSNLVALVRYAESERLRLPQLKRILTLGEALPEGCREAARLGFGAEVSDAYSANEVGYIAIQCPECEAYHVQSEAVLVEILDDHGKPCVTGETGRVVLTLLHNYAMPLIRYEIGDYAVVGGRCRCGRGLPVLTNILGRQRNMMVLADGSSFWPSFGTKRLRQLAPVSQHQFVQHTPARLEVRLVVERDVTEAEERAMRRHIQSRLPAPTEIDFTYVDDIPRSASGKYEDLICLVEERDASAGESPVTERPT